LDIRTKEVIFSSTGVVKDIPGSVNNQGNRGCFFNIHFHFFVHVFAVKVQEKEGSASYGQNKTIKQSNDLVYVIMGL